MAKATLSEERKRVKFFNRVVVMVRPKDRFAVDRITEEGNYKSPSSVYREVIEAGLKAKFPKEYARLQVEFREHVAECVQEDRSSKYFNNRI